MRCPNYTAFLIYKPIIKTHKKPLSSLKKIWLGLLFLSHYHHTSQLVLQKITQMWRRWGTLEISFCHSLMNFGKPEKSDFSKNEKNCWRYHHFTHVYQKTRSYEVQLLRYRVTQNFMWLKVLDPAFRRTLGRLCHDDWLLLFYLKGFSLIALPGVPLHAFTYFALSGQLIVEWFASLSLFALTISLLCLLFHFLVLSGLFIIRAMVFRIKHFYFTIPILA